jgi:phospholipid/cholesterol/gamma-HCH transport system substrate-binding protein
VDQPSQHPKAGRFKKTWERVRNEPQLGRNVAIIAVLLVLGSVAGGYILSNQRFEWPWEDPFTFSAEFTEAPAISPGNGQEVRIAGVQVGEIRSAGLSRDGKAKLELTVDRAHPVYDNATMLLRPKSPLNEMYIELNPGGPPARPLGDEAVLPVQHSQHPVQIDAVLGHLDDNTRNALGSLVNESDAALANAPQALGPGLSATDKVTKDLQPVLSALRERKDKLARMVHALSELSTSVGGDDKRLAQLATDLQRTLGVLGNQSDPLNRALTQLPDLADQLKAATGSVQGLSDQLDPTLDSVKKATGTVPDALGSLKGTLSQVGSTVDVARPVVSKAKPVVASLRPLVSDVNAALPDTRESTHRLDPVTSALIPYLNDAGAWIYNTYSTASLQDANGGILRGLLQVSPSSVPLLKNLAPMQAQPAPPGAPENPLQPLPNLQLPLPR